jgi:hypothetical protein
MVWSFVLRPPFRRIPNSEAPPQMVWPFVLRKRAGPRRNYTFRLFINDS